MIIATIITRLLWAIGLIPVCLLAAPVIPLVLMADCVCWIATGKNHDLAFRMSDHPPMKWVRRYLSIYG